MRPRQCEIDRAVLAFTSHGQQPDPVLTPEQVVKFQAESYTHQPICHSHEALREQLQTEREISAAGWKAANGLADGQLDGAVEAIRESAQLRKQLREVGEGVRMADAALDRETDRIRRLRDAIGTTVEAFAPEGHVERIEGEVREYRAGMSVDEAGPLDAAISILGRLGIELRRLRLAEIAKEGQDDD